MTKKCYDYTVRWKGSKGRYSGWINGLSEVDAWLSLYKKYGRDKFEFEVIKLQDTGKTWETFIKQGDSYGWD